MSVDMMGWTKDLLDDPNRPDVLQITAEVSSVKTQLNPKYIGTSVIMNDNADAIAARGSPFGIEPAVYNKKFTDAIHAQGMNVLHRCTDAHFEGLYGYTGAQVWVGANRYAVGDPNQVIGVAFNDTFSGTTPGSNYTTAADGGSGSGNIWTVSNGELIGPGGDGWKRSILTVAQFGDCVATAKVKKVGHQQIIVRATTDSNFPGYGLQMRDTTLRIERPGLANIGEVAFSWVEGSYYWLKLEASGSTIRGKAWLDGTSEPISWNISVTDTTYPNPGGVGFSGESSTGHFDSLTVTQTPVRNNWLGRVYNYIINNPGLFADGDLWGPFPEATGHGIFSDSSSFLPNTAPGVQQNYALFFQGIKQVSDAAFAIIGKNVTTGMSSHNWSEIASGWMPASTHFTYVVFDHYGTQGAGHSPQEMLDNIRQVVTTYGKKAFLQEWGDYWSTDPQYGFNRNQAQQEAYLQTMYDAFQTLINEGTLIGFNYWRVSGGAEQIMVDVDATSGFDYELNYAGVKLQQFFDLNTPSASVSISPSSSISPSASRSPSSSASPSVGNSSISPSASISASTSPSASISPSSSNSPSPSPSPTWKFRRKIPLLI